MTKTKNLQKFIKEMKDYISKNGGEGYVKSSLFLLFMRALEEDLIDKQ